MLFNVSFTRFQEAIVLIRCCNHFQEILKKSCQFPSEVICLRELKKRFLIKFLFSNFELIYKVNYLNI